MTDHARPASISHMDGERGGRVDDDELWLAVIFAVVALAVALAVPLPGYG